MKILFFTHYGELYGANRSLLDLLDNQDIFLPIVVCPKKGEFYLEIKKRNIRCYPLKILPLFGLKKRIFPLMFLSKVINNIVSLFLLIIILFWNNIDFIYSNSSVITIGLILSKITNKRHIWHIRELYDLHYNLKFYFGDKVFKYLVSKSDIVISISHYVENVTLKGIDVHKYVIYDGTKYPPDFIKKIDKEKYLVGNISFGIVGKIYPQKNIHIVLNAFNKFSLLFPKSSLMVIGDVHDKEYYESLKVIADNNNVIFTGHIREINEIYKKFDILIMSSEHEGLGRAVFEAMSFGIPVIGNNSGGIPELIEHGIDGLLYSGTTDDLYDKMKFIISDYERFDSIRLNGLSKVEKNFSVNNYSSQIIDIIQKLYERSLS